jgi:hypothetical protein
MELPSYQLRPLAVANNQRTGGDSRRERIIAQLSRSIRSPAGGVTSFRDTARMRTTDGQ